MMRTLFSGILGLRVHQTEMDVIGNNVANVNTYGFKKGRVVFQDILSQTVGASSAPTGKTGGINAQQIGLGSRVSSVDNIFTQGALESTGRANDIAIEGDGFFVLQDAEGRQLYTRAGTLDVDASGNLIHSGTGYLLKGWDAKEDPFTKDIEVDTTRPISTLNLTALEKLAARATSEVEYRSNLTSTAEERSLPIERMMTFTDDQGNDQEVAFRFLKINKNTWNWIAVDDTEGQVGNGVLVFDDNGKIVSSTGGPILSFDPDGASGSPPELNLQENNTAAITNAEFRPLIAETWSTEYAFSFSGTQASTDSLLLNQLYDTTTLPARPGVPPLPPASLGSPQFDLRGINGNEQVIINGIDGNGDTIENEVFPVTTQSTIADLVQFIDKAFPNAIATFNPNTGKIELKDASAGVQRPCSFTLQFVDPDNATSFPGLITTTTADATRAGGVSRLVAGAGTVKDGVHSITVKRIDATPSTVTGNVTGLTRFTSFAELDIGDTSNFAISIDGSSPQVIYGLTPGQYATQTAPNSIPVLTPGNSYGAGNVVINGFATAWNAAAVAGMNQDAFGAFLAQQITTTFDTVAISAPEQAIYAHYDNVNKKLVLTHRMRGASFKIDVTSASNPNQTGLDPNYPVSYGTDGSTIGDLIDAVNNQLPGTVLEIDGDRLALKRAVTGAQFNVAVADATGSGTGAYATPTTPPTPSNWSIAQKVFGSDAPLTTPGTDQTYTLIDLFTPTDGTGTVALTYNDFKSGQTIGSDAIGNIIIESTGLQPGTCTITTVGEEDAGQVRVAVPTVNAYSADFSVQTGGQAITDVTVAMIPGAKHVASTTVYDSLGNAHVVNMTFEKVEPNKWQYASSLDVNDELVQRYFETHPMEGDAPTDLELNFAADSIIANRRGLLVFNEFGKVDENKTSSVNAVNLPDLVKTISFTPADANTVNIMPSFHGVTQFDSGFSTAARSQNGYAMGMLQSFEIGSTGVIVGAYTNGFKRDIGQVAVANFTNSSGLEKESDATFSESANSGLPRIGEAGTGGRGSVASQTLEMSNVDLAQEFTDMIIAQRGFQANAKTITTADEVLQELINLKR